jgi:polyhydroxyalkanoate synthesis regulator protein
MDIEFKGNKVEILMQSYLKEALEAFPEDTSRSITSPAANHLYTVNPNAKKLP